MPRTKYTECIQYKKGNNTEKEIFIAIKNGARDDLIMALEGIELNTHTRIYGEPPLNIAVMCKDPIILQILQENGACMYDKGDDGVDALGLCTELYKNDPSFEQCLKYLLRGIDHVNHIRCR